MKLIIAGGRDLTVTESFMWETLKFFKLDPLEVVSGGAKGIDRCGENFVTVFNQLNSGTGAGSAGPFVSKHIDLKIFEADWETHGKAAGPIRNAEMADYGDALLLIWDGESRGSLNMKETMLKANKPVYEVIVKK